MYSKLYRTIFDGSLYGQFEALTVFMAMLALADRHGEVDAAPAKIAGCLGCDIKFVHDGITSLRAPDPYSRTPIEEGRRIIPLVDDEGNSRPFGWKIVNYEKYRSIRNEEERRAYKRDWDRTHRGKSVPTKSDRARPEPTYTEAEAEAEAVKREKTPPRKSKNGKALPKDWTLPNDWRTWTETKCPLVDPDTTAEEMKDWALGNSNRPIAKKADWFATWRNWCRRDQTKYEEQEKWAKKRR